MLLRRPLTVPLPTVIKTVGGRDASDKGAFSCGDTLSFSVRVHRALGAGAVVLRIAPDGGEERDLPLSFTESENGIDTYTLSLPLADLCGRRGEGLFFYEFLFLRGKDTLFTHAVNHVDLVLADHAGPRFSLLVTEETFDCPARFCGRTMYHIFVDRFAPGGGERREDAVYHRDWNEEILQFGAYPGAPVKNNEFFGGTLWGIIDKLDYLASLGVGIIYLSPIFKAASNHKYDTGDYETVEPQFGGEEALRALIAACEARNIDLMLDGVFNHTGDDSRYFNKYGSYPGIGAYQSKASPYYDWYHFHDFPDNYESWWGIGILPKLNLFRNEPCDYFVGRGGIIEKYTRMGIKNWRLDVADELPDHFLDDLRLQVKGCTAGEGTVIGEVWENAAEKEAYGRRRRYFRGRQLDGVMNYPLRRGLVSFAREGDARALAAVLRELWWSYPTSCCHHLMNILSTHDTERILTVLGGELDYGQYTNAELRDKRMTRQQRAAAKKRLMLAATLQYTVYGVPSLFYGDEVGMEGYHDPFCRRPYPWGGEDRTLLAHYKKLGRIRAENRVLADGDFKMLSLTDRALAFERRNESGHLIVAANRGEEIFSVALPRGKWKDLMTGRITEGEGTVLPDTAAVWRLQDASTRD